MVRGGKKDLLGGDRPKGSEEIFPYKRVGGKYDWEI